MTFWLLQPAAPFSSLHTPASSWWLSSLSPFTYPSIMLMDLCAGQSHDFSFLIWQCQQPSLGAYLQQFLLLSVLLWSHSHLLTPSKASAFSIWHVDVLHGPVTQFPDHFAGSSLDPFWDWPLAGYPLSASLDLNSKHAWLLSCSHLTGGHEVPLNCGLNLWPFAHSSAQPQLLKTAAWARDSSFYLSRQTNSMALREEYHVRGTEKKAREELQKVREEI